MDGTRAANCSKTNRRRHPVAKIKGGWSKEEDDLLRGLVEEIGEGNWSAIARALNALTGKDESNGRIGKQCRERFNHHLRPGLTKEAWTVAEEELLVQAHRELGNRWSDIARRIPGRSENSVKNHWNATLRRRDTPEPNPGPLKVYMQGLHLLGPGGGSRGAGGHSGGGGSRSKGGKRGAPQTRSAAAMCDDSDAETTEEEEEEVLEQMLAEEDALSSGDEGGGAGERGASGSCGGGMSTRARKRRVQPARGSTARTAATESNGGATLPAHGSSASLTNYALSNGEGAQMSGDATGVAYPPAAHPPQQGYPAAAHQPTNYQNPSYPSDPGWGLPVTTTLVHAPAHNPQPPQPPAPTAGNCRASVFTLAQSWQQAQLQTKQQHHQGHQVCAAGAAGAGAPQYGHMPQHHHQHSLHHQGSLAMSVSMGSLPSAAPLAGSYTDFHMGAMPQQQQHGGPRLMRRRSTAGSRLHELVKMEQEAGAGGEEAAGEGMVVEGMVPSDQTRSDQIKREQQYHVPQPSMQYQQYQQELQEREALAAGIAAAGADTDPDPYLRLSTGGAHVPGMPQAAPQGMPPHHHSPPGGLISPRTSSNGPNVPLGQRAFNNSSRPAALPSVMGCAAAMHQQHNMGNPIRPAGQMSSNPAAPSVQPAAPTPPVPAAPSPPPLLPPSVNAAAAAAAPGEGGAALLNALVTPGEDDMVEDDADLLALLAQLHDVPTPPPILANTGDNNHAPVSEHNASNCGADAGQVFATQHGSNATAAAVQQPHRGPTGGKTLPGSKAPPAVTAGGPAPAAAAGATAPPAAGPGVPRTGSHTNLYNMGHTSAPPPPPKGYLIDEGLGAAGGYGAPHRTSGGGVLMFDDSTTHQAVSRSGSNSSFYSTYGPPPRSPPKGGSLRRCAASSSNLTTMAALGGNAPHPPHAPVHHHHSLPTILDTTTEEPSLYAPAGSAPAHLLGPAGDPAAASWDGGSESHASHTMLGGAGPGSGHSFAHLGTSPPSAGATGHMHHTGVLPPPAWGCTTAAGRLNTHIPPGGPSAPAPGAGGSAPAFPSDEGPMTVDLSSPCRQMRVLITDQPLPPAEVLLTEALPTPASSVPPSQRPSGNYEEVKLGSMGPLRADLQAIMARAGAATGTTPHTTQEALSAMGSLLMGVLTGNAEAAAAATAAACAGTASLALPFDPPSQGGGRGKGRLVQQALLALRLGLDTPPDQYSVVVVLRGPHQAPLQVAAQVLSSELGTLVCH